MMKIYIGIDVGTTSLKALALTEKGECVATAKSSYELFASGAEATQNANDWYGRSVTSLEMNSNFIQLVFLPLFIKHDFHVL